MQTKKAKYHLKRIETILDLHKDGLSRLDRDILLEDIRRLYELVCETEVVSFQDVPVASRDNTYLALNDAVANKSEIYEDDSVDPDKMFASSDNRSHDKVEDQASVVAGKAEVYIADTQELPDQVESDHTPTTVTYEDHAPDVHSMDKESTHYQSASKIEENGATSSPPVQAQPQEDYEDVLVEESVDYPELFDFVSSAELSERLANSKIDQLNKILSINDKILYINHLFGGEAIPFQENLKKFENFYTYEEARKFASEELVTEYNWTDKDKLDTVRQFMRQVKRLYS